MPERILIVDDDHDTLHMVGIILQGQGYQTLSTDNGRDALRIAKAELPDLVLLDIMMPDLDGLEVTRQLRADPTTQDIPVIVFTAIARLDDKLHGFEAGADDYLTKPTQPRELFAHIRAVLSRYTKAKTGPLGLPAALPSPRAGRLIGVLAARGGLGVSTLALNLGLSLYNLTQKSTVVAEYRPGYGAISQELGFAEPEGLNRLLQLRPEEITPTGIEAELTDTQWGPRVLLASPRPKDAQYSHAVRTFASITRQIRFLAEYAILDLGSSLSPTNQKVIPMCDELIVVVEPQMNTVRQTKALIQDLTEMGYGADHIRLVLYHRIRSESQVTYEQVRAAFENYILLVIAPAPEQAYQANMQNIPLILAGPESLVTQQFNELAGMIDERKPSTGGR